MSFLVNTAASELIETESMPALKKRLREKKKLLDRLREEDL
ncbi:MAG: hypothetical protein QXR97_04560 [Thermoproteota archaeon]